MGALQAINSPAKSMPSLYFFSSRSGSEERGTRKAEDESTVEVHVPTATSFYGRQRFDKEARMSERTASAEMKTDESIDSEYPGIPPMVPPARPHVRYFNTLHDLESQVNAPLGMSKQPDYDDSNEIFLPQLASQAVDQEGPSRSMPGSPTPPKGDSYQSFQASRASQEGHQTRGASSRSSHRHEFTDEMAMRPQAPHDTPTEHQLSGKTPPTSNNPPDRPSRVGPAMQESN